MELTHHYPPELMSLLIDTIPRLFRSKDAVLGFFRSAGVGERFTGSIAARLKSDRSSLNKFQIVREVLTALNNAGDVTLGERREIVRRVVQFDEFSTLWPDDQLPARGLVTQIQKVVDAKDAFTRMKLEAEQAKRSAIEERNAILEGKRRKLAERRAIFQDLGRLFTMAPGRARGQALEPILNRAFASFEVGIAESFYLVGRENEGIVEQVDGVIKLDGHHYIVEMKWHSAPIGVEHVSHHLVRVISRSGARGLIISASGFTDPAITECRNFLNHAPIVMMELQEISETLESEGDLLALLKSRVDRAITLKEPFKKRS